MTQLVLLAALVAACGQERAAPETAPAPVPQPPSTQPSPPPAVAAEPEPAVIAVTIDDLPFVGPVGPGDSREAATDRMMWALRSHHVIATGFVVCRTLARQRGIVQKWLDAGMELGNHTRTHRDLEQVEPAEWEEEVASCRTEITALTGTPPRYFRYPYLRQGETAERRDAAAAFVRGLGHELAPVSVDTNEWMLVAPYVRALERGDDAEAQRVGNAYVTHVMESVRHFRRVARERVGRDVRHVLLLHANAIAADRLDELLTAIEGEGLRFVPLAEALADPVYARRDDYAGRETISWLYRFEPVMTDRTFDDAQNAFLASFDRSRGPE